MWSHDKRGQLSKFRTLLFEIFFNASLDIYSIVARILLCHLNLFVTYVYQASELQQKIENAGGKTLKDQKAKVGNIQSVSMWSFA